MRNLFLAAVAMLMTATFAFAATSSQTPSQKGTEYAQKIIKALVVEDYDALYQNSENMGYYVVNLDESQIDSFFESFNEGIYYYCNYYGLGEEFAREFLESFYSSLLEELAAYAN